MFSKMLRLAVPDEKERSTLTNRYAVTAENARKVLKRSDRIIWYIQQVKISTMTQYGTGVPEQNQAAFQAELDKLLSKYDHDPKVIPNGLIYNLEHFLSLPVPEIQSYQFTNQSVSQVLSDFEQLETVWKESTKGLISPQPDDRILIDFGESAWWLLGRGACSTEGAAMGHCGNVPSERPGDRILSYRTRRTDDQWMVHLTFILDKHGYLGETKGRGNEKPAEKYHPFIIRLLEHDIVEGIKGGGYMPESNFTIYDLPESERDRLITLKPTLTRLSEMVIQLPQHDPTMRGAVLDEIDQYTGDKELFVNDDNTNGYILIQQFDSVKHLVKEVVTDSDLYEYLDSDADLPIPDWVDSFLDREESGASFRTLVNMDSDLQDQLYSLLSELDPDIPHTEHDLYKYLRLAALETDDSELQHSINTQLATVKKLLNSCTRKNMESVAREQIPIEIKREITEIDPDQDYAFIIHDPDDWVNSPVDLIVTLDQIIARIHMEHELLNEVEHVDEVVDELIKNAPYEVSILGDALDKIIPDHRATECFNKQLRKML